MPPCTPQALFAAAVRKEHFNPHDPSYATMGQRATAYGTICDGEWAFAAVSRPNVGTTDGATLFKSNGAGTWVEVYEMGYLVNACAFRAHGVLAAIALVLARGVAGGAYCDLPHAYALARTLWLSSRCDAPNQLGALQGDWPAVAQTLQESEPAYGGNPVAYRTAIGDLTRVSTIVRSGNFLLGPGGADGTVLTSTNAAFAADINQLDAFFHTPHFFTAPTLPVCYVS